MRGRRVLVWGCLLCLFGPAVRLSAEIGTIDEVPAATLLLPYFEVDFADPKGITTLFSINNASAGAAVAHVTLWTDESIPTLDFDVYLTGYDVQTINLRDVFNGKLPRTADPSADPGDAISPVGALSLDVAFPGSTGPCAQPYPLSGALSAALIDHLRTSHTGRFSPLYGGCSGASYGDAIARGYVTVDSVTACNLSFPSDAGYFTSLADNRNILWGDFLLIDGGESAALAQPLVHIEACSAPSVGNGAGLCPFSFAAGDYTFYGRYNAVAGQDQREPLTGTDIDADPDTFAVRYLNGGAFAGGTDLIVWRDSKTRPSGADGTHSCVARPSWFPLGQGDVTAFDEEENPTALCFEEDNVSPPTGGGPTCFPLEAQRIHLAGGNVIGDQPLPPAPFGWLDLDLSHTLTSGDPYPGRAQAVVLVVMYGGGGNKRLKPIIVHNALRIRK